MKITFIEGKSHTKSISANADKHKTQRMKLSEKGPVDRDETKWLEKISIKILVL